MDDKIYELMAQAEVLQEHALAIQNKASEAISEIPEAIDVATEKIRFTALLSVIIWIIVGVAIFLGVWIALEWSTSNLQEERIRLQSQIGELQGIVQDEEDKISEMRSESWGIELIENDGKRWIKLRKGDVVSETRTGKNGIVWINITQEK